MPRFALLRIVLLLLSPASCQLPTGMTDTTADATGESASSSTAPTPEGESVSSTTSPTTTGEVPSTGTTAEPLSEWDAGCTAWCEQAFGCIGPPSYPDLDACISTCVADPPNSQRCISAQTDLWQCVGGLSCEELHTFLFEHDWGECTDEFLGAADVCACSTFQGGADGHCAVKRWCPEHPTIEIDCDESTCVCKTDDELVGSCPAQGFCDLDGPGQYEAAEACCGLVFSPLPDI
ncbi:hypothetical protein [Nannocystis sp. SCPEA4]|uniref:hypothetical protein n=1 Tax=Nannocystis sp. SCPEA4 TaxID=2996787 RepID=UPI00226FD69E|nr:hypothetical protein [Nannocystis sp. SCPEA4]MCY1055756.1 hypothetical protein [Nannocystis sp. SCPEA4]